MNPKLTTLILFVVLFLASAAPALAQCSMCRENAAAADNSRAINLGIIVLLVPTLTLFVGVLAFALTRRNPDGAAAALKLADTTQIPRTSSFSCDSAD